MESNREAPTDRSLAGGAGLASAATLVVTTFRRSGQPVPTPVWGAWVEGVPYFTAPASTGKVKRLAHTERVEIAEGTERGEPVGDPLPATARRVDDEDTCRAVKAELLRRHPVGHRIISGWYRVRRVRQVTYRVDLGDSLERKDR